MAFLHLQHLFILHQTLYQNSEAAGSLLTPGILLVVHISTCSPREGGNTVLGGKISDFPQLFLREERLQASEHLHGLLWIHSSKSISVLHFTCSLLGHSWRCSMWDFRLIWWMRNNISPAAQKQESSDKGIAAFPLAELSLLPGPKSAESQPCFTQHFAAASVKGLLEIASIYSSV